MAQSHSDPFCCQFRKWFKRITEGWTFLTELRLDREVRSDNSLSRSVFMCFFTICATHIIYDASPLLDEKYKCKIWIFKSQHSQNLRFICAKSGQIRQTPTKDIVCKAFLLKKISKICWHRFVKSHRSIKLLFNFLIGFVYFQLSVFNWAVKSSHE